MQSAPARLLRLVCSGSSAPAVCYVTAAQVAVTPPALCKITKSKTRQRAVDKPPSYSGLVRRPLTAVTRVQIPLGVPRKKATQETEWPSLYLDFYISMGARLNVPGFLASASQNLGEPVGCSHHGTCVQAARLAAEALHRAGDGYSGNNSA